MKLIKRVSTVDPAKCIACKQCEIHCPSRAIKVKTEAGEQSLSPCMSQCPAHINVPGYIALAKAGRYEDAYRLIRQNNPFPSVCGRICTHPCQKACNRGLHDGEVGIRDIKRFVSDYVFYNGKVVKEPVWDKNGKKVAVIGAGPSGLSCAYFLALSGYEVEVFEQQPVAGGVLLFGIPEYRLPKDVLAREVREIEDLGVKIHLSTEVGKDITFEELQDRFDSIYISTGAQFSRKAGIPGEDLPGVYHGLDFLRDVNLGGTPAVGKKTVIIGGGNTAIDASRTAVRLGAEEVTILYRRRRIDMPADDREIIEALEEGVKILPLAAPVEITGDGKVQGVTCSRMELGEKDASGRRSPHIVEGQDFAIEADTVIVAVSQYSDLPFISKDEVVQTKWGGIGTDDRMMTTIPGVFSGGDVAKGPDTAISAIADGKMAALYIAQYLGGSAINSGQDIELPGREEYRWNQHQQYRMPMLDPETRIKSNDEVALGMTEEMLHDECTRCLRCTGHAVVDETICVDCGMCFEHCMQGAIKMEILPETKLLKHREPTYEELDEAFEILKRAQRLPSAYTCACTMTSNMEVIGAIFDGATTVEELTRATGIRSGCGGIYCIQNAVRILEAAGYPQEAPADGAWYPIKPTIYSISKENADNLPILHIEEYQGSSWSDDIFEKAKALYLERRKASEQADK